MDLKDKLFLKLKEKQSQMTEVRTYLANHPEMPADEEKNSRYIANCYSGSNCYVYLDVGGHGVMAVADSGKPGKHVAICADFSAWIKKDVNGKSIPEYTNGHDGMTAALLILAESIMEIQTDFSGKVTFIHQSGSDQLSGSAPKILKAANKLLDVDGLLCLNFSKDIAKGVLAYSEGVSSICKYGFTAIFSQKSQKTNLSQSTLMHQDLLQPVAEFITKYQTVTNQVKKPFDFLKVSIGSSNELGIQQLNSDSVAINGNVNCLRSQLGKSALAELETITHGIAIANQVDYQWHRQLIHPPLINDSNLTQFTINKLQNTEIDSLKEIIAYPVQNKSSDFAYFSQQKPCCQLYLGCGTEEDQEIDENLMLLAAEVLGSSLVDLLVSQ